MKPYDVLSRIGLKGIHPRVPFMTLPQAELLYGLITDNGFQRVLELGFFHGTSTCCIAGALQDVGGGTELITIDRTDSKDLSPTVEQQLQLTGLSDENVSIRRHSCFTWELMHLLEESPRPQFDLIYLDGGHMWKEDGFSFLLAEKMLRVGGIVVLDDLHRVRMTRARKLFDTGKDTKMLEWFNQRLSTGDPGERELLTEPLIYKVWTLLVKEHPNMAEFVEYDSTIGNPWGMASSRKIREAK